MILVAFEESQTVTKAFRDAGHETFSCDTAKCSGGRPEWHVQDDAFKVIESRPWELVIAHPPCTHLSNAGAQYWPQKQKDGRQQKAIFDFLCLATLAKNIPYFAIENPVGKISSVWRKPDQIIQPYQFGDAFSKRTCLWLFNLPELKPTGIVGRGEYLRFPGGGGLPAWYSRASGLPPKERRRVRSRTFPGIAAAMASQWGEYIKRKRGEK